MLATRYLLRLPSGEYRIAKVRLERAADLLGVDRKDFAPHKLGAEGVCRIRDEMIERHSTPTAINNMLDTLRSVTRFAFESGVVREEDLLAVEAVPGLTDVKQQRRLLSGREISAVVAACIREETIKGARDAAIICTLYAGGLSAAELVGLGVDAWFEDKDVLRVHEEGGSGGPPVPIGSDASRVLRRWLMLRGPYPGRLFLPVDGEDRVCGERLHAAAISGILNKRADQAEVVRFTCRDLRVTAAADMLRAGAGDRQISRILGEPVPRVGAADEDDGLAGVKIRAVTLNSEHVDYFDLIGFPEARTPTLWGVPKESSFASGWIDTSQGTPAPHLGGSVSASSGEIAYGCTGHGSPVVLVHASAGRALSWRGVASALAERHAVYAPDLPGHGESEYRDGQDLSIAAHARTLTELVEHWGLSGCRSPPDMAGEGTGAAIALRAYLLEGMPVRRMVLLNPVIIDAQITEAERHLQNYPEAYLTMPETLFEATLQTRAKEEVGVRAGSGATEFFVSQWAGKRGRLAYVQTARAFDESHCADFETLLGSMSIPVLILSGADEMEVYNLAANRLKDAIPAARLGSIPWAGRLLTEEAPDDVAHALGSFFST